MQFQAHLDSLDELYVFLVADRVMDIISKINEQAEKIKESDLKEWVIPELMKYYQTRISTYSQRAYGSSGGTVAKNAFRASAEETLFNGLTTFLFKSQHWRTGRDINTYLLTCVKRLADQIYWDQSSAKRANILICPACRELGSKIFLVSESKLWRCATCTTEVNRLNEDIRKGTNLTALRARMQLHKAFVLHSRRGYRCGEPSCNRFIPETLNGKFGIQCPYPDCDFFGSLEDLKSMSHPSALTHRQMVSLSTPLTLQKGRGSNEMCLQDMFESDDIAPDEALVVKQVFSREYSTLLSIIDQQIAGVKRISGNTTKLHKILMYEAFKIMCQKNPEEMVSYLVHLKQSAEAPIQSRIFQEYVGLIENSLPFTLEKHGEPIEIISISDPYLGLFIGRSIFDATVKENGIIPNNTVETYTGSRKFKMFGPCFIGKLINVTDKTSGNSVLDKIKSYNFVQIESSLTPGTQVEVTHYRIPSHYEMGSLVYLQRIRRHLVDKIYFKLHGKRRVPGSSEAKK